MIVVDSILWYVNGKSYIPEIWPNRGVQIALILAYQSYSNTRDPGTRSSGTERLHKSSTMIRYGRGIERMPPTTKRMIPTREREARASETGATPIVVSVLLVTTIFRMVIQVGA